MEPYTYSLSAVAWDSSRLIGLDAKKMRATLGEHPEVGYKVMRALSVVTARRLNQMAEVLGRELLYSAIRP